MHTRTFVVSLSVVIIVPGNINNPKLLNISASSTQPVHKTNENMFRNKMLSDKHYQ